MALLIALLLLLMIPGLLTCFPARSKRDWPAGNGGAERAEPAMRRPDALSDVHSSDCGKTSLPQDGLDGDRDSQDERQQ